MASAPSKVNQSSLQSLWTSMDISEDSKAPVQESRGVRSFASTSCEESVKKINWIIENRGGMAVLTGLVMVPSQFLRPGAKESSRVIAQAQRSKEFRAERFFIPGDDHTSLHGVVYYPKNWNPEDRSRCILYHNPNGITVSGYFETGVLAWTPAEIVKLAGCPIVMYDYRGTGLSSENTSLSSLRFRPTYESVVADGESALLYALRKFESVRVAGSSLGGGVATASLDRHLEKIPDDSWKVSLLNHDSFSTTARVVLPGWPTIADWTGWAVGGLLDAGIPMKRLIQRGIPITILCHKQDPVIPQGARMAEYVEALPQARNVTLIYSQRYGHADLSQDMSQALGRI